MADRKIDIVDSRKKMGKGAGKKPNRKRPRSGFDLKKIKELFAPQKVVSIVSVFFRKNEAVLVKASVNAKKPKLLESRIIELSETDSYEKNLEKVIQKTPNKFFEDTAMVLSLPPEAYESKNIFLPPLGEKELAQTISNQLARKTKSHSDYLVLKDLVEDGKTKKNVFLYSVEKKLVKKMISIADKNKIPIRAIVPNEKTVLNITTLGMFVGESDLFIVADLGWDSFRMYLFSGGELLNIRENNFGFKKLLAKVKPLLKEQKLSSNKDMIQILEANRIFSP
ncbi:MAG: hypothetical protein ACI9BD_001216, partial [Candidatus Marinamargulisbacteria bacterium]